MFASDTADYSFLLKTGIFIFKTTEGAIYRFIYVELFGVLDCLYWIIVRKLIHDYYLTDIYTAVF